MVDPPAVPSVPVHVTSNDSSRGRRCCCSSRRSKLRLIFAMLTSLSVIINLDGGAVPAALLQIEQTFSLNTFQIGLLGMLVYEGIGIGSLVVGPLLRYVSATRATQCTLILNMCATALFGASTSATQLLVFRVSIGLLQGIPAVYFPIWVDSFAPADSASLWMALIQAGAPLGIMAGYVFSGVVSGQNDPDYVCEETNIWCGWRWPFYLQSIALVGFSLAFLMVPKELYDLGNDGHALPYESSQREEEEVEEANAAASVPAQQALSSTSTRHSSTSRASSRARSESMSDQFGFYLTEALLPMAARNALVNEVAVGELVIAPAKKGRMEARIRRMSNTPMYDSSRDSDGAPLDGANASDSPDAKITTPVVDRVSRVAERLSVRHPRLTMVTNEDGHGHGGRPRVVSAVDVFFPNDRRSVDSNASRISSTSTATAASTSFKPTLPSIQSTAVLLEEGSTPTTPAAGSAALATQDLASRPVIVQLATNGVFVCLVLSLSCLFFVVTGIQFWVTAYIIRVIKMPQAAVTPAFGATSILAPVFGVVSGGIFIDKIGGYKGQKALARTLKWCFVFEACAAVAAIATAYVPKYIAVDQGSSLGGFWACIGLIALTLIFGGAVMPAAQGCIISVVHPSIRQYSSAVSMFTFQQLGYALAPIVSAAVASCATVDREAVASTLNASVVANVTLFEAALEEVRYLEALDMALQVVMWWGALGVAFMGLAWYIAANTTDPFEEADNAEESAKVGGASVPKAAKTSGKEAAKGGTNGGVMTFDATSCSCSSVNEVDETEAETINSAVKQHSDRL